MGDKSFAARALLLLPFAGLAAWSGNATLVRMRHADTQALSHEFVVGSMDDMVADTLETGDLVFFTRNLMALQPLAALHTWLLRRACNPRFDAVGFIYVDRMGRKFVVEETLSKVQCRPYCARILTSESLEIVVLPLKKQEENNKKLQQSALDFIAQNVNRRSRMALKQAVLAWIDPKAYHPVDGGETPLFASAALVVEAYEAMGLVDKQAAQLLASDKRVTKATITPRHLAAGATQKSGASSTTNPAKGLLLRQDAHAQFGIPLPIRLH